MEKFISLTSTFISLPVAHVDTDQIIPARFLKATDRSGFGENLFRDWRYTASGEKNAGFVLNTGDPWAKILVAGKNFGCGSSREHAAWALYDYGFRAVVSSFFADIFKNNALNNCLLPVQVSEEFLMLLFSTAEKEPGARLSIDLPTQTIQLCSVGIRQEFELPAHKKMCLMEGLDDTSLVFSKKREIERYETISNYLEFN